MSVFTDGSGDDVIGIFKTFFLKVLGLELGWEGGTYSLPIILLKHLIPLLNWKLVPSPEVFQRKDMKNSQSHSSIKINFLET